MLVSLVALYGFGLFAWYWGRVGKASSMFIYVTLLFMGIAFDHGVGLCARSMRFTDSESYLVFMASWLWPARMYLLLAVLTAIVVHMTMRVYRNYVQAKSF